MYSGMTTDFEKSYPSNLLDQFPLGAKSAVPGRKLTCPNKG